MKGALVVSADTHVLSCLPPRSVFGRDGAEMAGLAGAQPLHVFLQSQSLIPSLGHRPVWLWRPGGGKLSDSNPSSSRTVLYVCPSVEHTEVSSQAPRPSRVSMLQPSPGATCGLDPHTRPMPHCPTPGGDHRPRAWRPERRLAGERNPGGGHRRPRGGHRRGTRGARSSPRGSSSLSLVSPIWRRTATLAHGLALSRLCIPGHRPLRAAFRRRDRVPLAHVPHRLRLCSREPGRAGAGLRPSHVGRVRRRSGHKGAQRVPSVGSIVSARLLDAAAEVGSRPTNPLNTAEARHLGLAQVLQRTPLVGRLERCAATARALPRSHVSLRRLQSQTGSLTGNPAAGH